MILQTIPIFSSLIFAFLYPLGFWLTHPDPIVPGFRRFNLGLSSFIGGLGTIGLLFLKPENEIKELAIVWLISSLIVTALLWNRGKVNPHLVTVPSVIGILLLGKLHRSFLQLPPDALWSTLLGGCVLCGVVYATVLGHWYLNVPGLPLKHLIHSVKFFWGCVLMRTLWDTYLIFQAQITYLGDSIPLFRYMNHTEGIFLYVALLFGCLLPLIGNRFVLGTLEVKNTQSATGILYALLIGIFMGDLVYKYYLFRHGIAL